MTSWRWIWFTAAAAVAAWFGVSWAFGRGRSVPLRVAGLFLLLIVAGWLAGAGGAAIVQYVPQWVAGARSWLAGKGVGSVGQGQGQG